MKQKKTASRLLETLKDGHFYSGEALGQALGITRSGVWKALKQLRESGIELQSVSGRGYRIPGGLVLLDENKIIAALSKKTATKIDDFFLLHSTDSTNTFLMKKSRNGNRQTLCCFSESQKQGRGRLGRTWVSPFGTNLYHSTSYHFNKNPEFLSGLSMAVSLAIAQALESYGIKKGLHLKWPNDILYQQHKLGGALLELAQHGDRDCTVIIGIGINTRMSSEQAASIDQDWTSLEAILDKPVDRNRLAALLLNKLFPTLAKFEKYGLSPFLKLWDEYDRHQGRQVILHAHGNKIHGTMKGVTTRGELILLDENKKQQRFVSGEVTLRLEKDIA